MTEIAVLSIPIEADPKKFEEALRRVEQQGAKAKPIRVPFDVDTKASTAAIQAAEAKTLSLFAARAKFQAAGGDLAGAERTLAGALSATTSTTAKSISVETQLLRVRQQIAKQGQGGGKGFAATIQQLGGTAGKIDQLVGSVTALGGAFATVQAVGAAVDFARQGASIDAARQSFDKLAASAGTSGQALLKALQDASAGTVAQTDIIKSSNTALLLLGSDVATKLPQLLQIAKASATTLGTDVGQVFDSLVTGISRGSTELIDNAGITVKAGEAYATYAASIGKSADSLSSAEKQQAILNAVLTAGQDIVDQTSGGGEAAAANFQRMDASLKDLTATAQVAAASGFAPVAQGVANIADAVNAGISQLVTYGDQIDQLNQRIIAGSSGYEGYRASVEATNAQIREGYGIFGIFAGVITPLSEEAYNLQQGLIASGVGAEQAAVQARAYQDALNAIAEAQNLASITMDEVSAQYAAVAAAAQEALTADAALAPQIQGIVDAYTARNISAQEAQAQIAALVAAQAEEAAAAEQAALAAYRQGEAGVTAAQAARDQAAAAQAAVEATNAQAVASLEQAASSDQAALAQDALKAAILEAAAAGGDAEAAAQRIKAQFDGVEAPAVANLIRLHRELAAARAGAAAASSGGTLSADAASALSGFDAGTVAKQRVANARARYEAEQAAKAERAAKAAARGGGGGGGGGKTPKVSAAEKEAQQVAKVENQYQKARLNAERAFQEASVEAEETYQERLLAIAEKYAAARAAAEKSFSDQQFDSRADFYTSLASVDKAQRTAMIQEFEAAQVKAAEIAATAGADAGERYLELITEIIRERAQRQAAIAKALEDGDKDEAEFLQGIDAIARQNEDRKLEDAAQGSDLAGKEAEDVAGATEARDEAIADADQRRQEALQAAGEKAGEALATAQQKLAGSTAISNEALTRQLALLQQIQQTGGAATAASAGVGVGGQGAPAAPTPATGGQGGQGGPLAVFDAASAAGQAAIAEQLRALARAFDKLAQRPAMGT